MTLTLECKCGCITEYWIGKDKFVGISTGAVTEHNFKIIKFDETANTLAYIQCQSCGEYGYI